VDPLSEMMTANEVAAFLKVNRATVYRLVKRKGLPSFRVGRITGSAVRKSAYESRQERRPAKNRER
jgi:excisionase family DNA binding protein